MHVHTCKINTVTCIPYIHSCIRREQANAMLVTMTTSMPTFRSLKSSGQPLVQQNNTFSKASTSFEVISVEGTQIDPTAAFEAVRENRAMLLTAIAEPLILATELYSKKVISQDALDKIRELPFTTRQKADVIVSSIESKMRTYPQDFRTFLSILANDSQLCIFAEKLRHSYSK